MLARIWGSTWGLIALVALTFAVATIGVGAIVYRVMGKALEVQLDHRIAMETRTLVARVGDDGLRGLAFSIKRRDRVRATSSLDYLLVDTDGRHLAGLIRAEIPQRPGHRRSFRYLRNGQEIVSQALVTPVEGGVLVVAADRADLAAIDRKLMYVSLGALAAMLGLGTAATILVGWTIRNRLERIDRTALAIIGGNLTERVPRDGSNSAIDRLAGTLNRMLDRIADLMNNLRQVSSDVAHDLRTPLTRLQNRLDRALEEGDPQSWGDAIEEARAETTEILEIFSALLRIAEVEGMGARLPRTPLDLSSLVEQMAETYRPDLDVAGRVLKCEIEPGIMVAGDRRLLSQAVANLLDNALRHSPQDARVTISLRGDQGEARIAVADDGPGVEPRERERLFQRFARSDRSRSTPGHGLGLALVAAIAGAHEGRAEFGEGEGFSIVIRLPGIAGTQREIIEARVDRHSSEPKEGRGEIEEAACV